MVHSIAAGRLLRNARVRRPPASLTLAIAVCVLSLAPDARWTQQDHLHASDAEAWDEFGSSAAISGNTVVIAAWKDDAISGGADAGSAYVFTRSGGTWSSSPRLFASDGAADDQFGNSVAIFGERIVVGAANDSGKWAASGSAYLFTRHGDHWSQQCHIFADDPGNGSEFGSSVGISGNTVVAGAHRDSTVAGSVVLWIT